RTLESLRRHAPEGTQVVIVADRPSPDQERALMDSDDPTAAPIAGASPEIVWTAGQLGRAAAMNAGIRRAIGRVVVLLDTSVELTGDLLGPLVEALNDETVALAGPWGLVSGDLRRFEPGQPGDVDAIEGAALAFRRSEIDRRGFLDEHFRLDLNLDIWWSLVLRDGDDNEQPRRALAAATAATRVIRHDPRVPTSDDRASDADRDRLSRRSFYRVLDRFGARRDLLTGNPPQSA
ncbi:MAG: glycosyltransferase, partial [Candidatus Limnocylindrales bacterium]